MEQTGMNPWLTDLLDREGALKMLPKA